MKTSSFWSSRPRPANASKARVSSFRASRSVRTGCPRSQLQKQTGHRSFEGTMAGCGKTCLRVLAQYLATARCLTVPPRRERTVVIAIPAAVINHLFLIPIPNKRVKSIRPRPGRQGWQSAFPKNPLNPFAETQRFRLFKAELPLRAVKHIRSPMSVRQTRYRISRPIAQPGAASQRRGTLIAM